MSGVKAARFRKFLSEPHIQKPHIIERHCRPALAHLNVDETIKNRACQKPAAYDFDSCARRRDLRLGLRKRSLPDSLGASPTDRSRFQPEKSRRALEARYYDSLKSESSRRCSKTWHASLVRRNRLQRELAGRDSPDRPGGGQEFGAPDPNIAEWYSNS